MVGKMEKRTAGLGLALVAIGLVTAAMAQGPRGGGRDGGPQGRPGLEQMPPPPHAAGAAMVISGDGLFVLTGPTVVKINPKTMEVVSQKELPRPALPGAPAATERP